MSESQVFQKFVPFMKVDAQKREVWGVVTAEVADKTGEICDYDSTKPYYKVWSNEFVKATDGKSCGNLRYMHSLRVVGKGVGIDFRDGDKEIWMGFKVTDNDAWNDVEEGVLTGFSQGGKYVKGPSVVDKRYTADPSEVSLVDNPCLDVAHFAYIKADGQIEMRKVRSIADPLPAAGAQKAFLAAGMDAPASEFPINVLTRAEAVEKGVVGQDSTNADYYEVRGFIKAADAKPLSREEIAAIVAEQLAKAGEAKDGPAPNKDVANTHIVTFVAPDISALHEMDDPNDPDIGTFQCTCGWTCDSDADAHKKIADHMAQNIQDPDSKALATAKSAASKAEPAMAAAPSIALVNLALDQVKKGMYDVAQFASLLDQLAWLQRMTEFESEMEGDNSTVPAELLRLVAELCQAFLAMATEETQELVARPEVGDAVAFAFASKAQVRKASALLAKAAEQIKAGIPAERETQTTMDLEKKAGLVAHLNKAKETAQANHEALQSHLDKCLSAVSGDDNKDAAKAAGAAATAATAAPAATATAAPAAAATAAPAEDLQKAQFGDMLKGFQNQFQEFMQTLQKTLEPPKAAQTGTVVTKTQDNAAAATAEGTQQAAPADPAFRPQGSAPAVQVTEEYRKAMSSVKGAPLSE